ncbi:MAG TPA: hypothetical protein VND93_29595, partial [Myxococcales bacterium]|nr:hypothetical protein [Myxococcales bacterium]
MRPVDLSQEVLPPAFPPEVLDPWRWPVLWRAPSGSGRTLVGKWLEAQDQAQFIQAETWADAVGQLSDGHAFVELMSAEGLPSKPAWLVCVAVDGGPTPSSPEPGKPPVEIAWRQIYSPPVESWIGDLVAWVDERASKAGGIGAKACLEWIREELLPERMVDGFGTALGFIGLFARYGKKVRHAGPAKLVDLFLKMRRAQFESRTELMSAPRLLGRVGDLARAILALGNRPLNEARGWDEWLALATSAKLATPEFLQTLRSDPGKVDESTLRKVVEDLQQSGQTALRSLRELQVLRQRQPGQFELSPGWLYNTLLIQAAEELLDQPPDAWGAVFLNLHGARFAMNRLCLRCLGGDFKPIQSLLENRQPRSPAWVAALEGAFRALGYALLFSNVEVPGSMLEDVLALQVRLLIDPEGWPRPRVDYGHKVDYPLLSHGLWLLGAHAIVEALEAANREELPAAFSLRKESFRESYQLGTVLSNVWSAMFTGDWSEEMQLGALSFYAQILPRIGPSHLPGTSAISPLQLPGYLLQRLGEGELDWDAVELQPWEKLFPLLRAFAEAHGQTWEAVVRALWMAWLRSGKTVPWFFGFDNPWAADLWALVPPEVISSGPIAWALREPRFPYGRFQEPQWRAFLEHWKNQRSQYTGDAAFPWKHMPPRIIQQALADGVIVSQEAAVVRQIWITAPAVVREQAELWIKEARWDPALMLVWAAPPEETPKLLAALHAAPPREEAPRLSLIRWLHGRITDRAPGWERAWEFLNDLTGITASPR